MGLAIGVEPDDQLNLVSYWDTEASNRGSCSPRSIVLMGPRVDPPVGAPVDIYSLIWNVHLPSQPNDQRFLLPSTSLTYTQNKN